MHHFYHKNYTFYAETKIITRNFMAMIRFNISTAFKRVIKIRLAYVLL